MENKKNFVKCKDCKLSFWLKAKDGKSKFICCRNILSENILFDEFNVKTYILRIKKFAEGCNLGIKKISARILFWK